MRHDIHSLIIYEDPHIIVCRKPAGIPTQTARIGTSDMESMLKNYLSGGYLAVIHRWKGSWSSRKHQEQQKN